MAMPTPAQAARPNFTGTYVTASSQGTITYKAAEFDTGRSRWSAGQKFRPECRMSFP